MKRKVFALLSALFLVLAIAVPAAANASGSYVLDEAQLLDEQQEKQLNELAASYTEKYDCGLYIATVDDYRTYGYDVMDAAMAIYKEHDMGAGSDKDGALLLLSMSDRDYSLICYGTWGNRVFDEDARDDIAQSFLPYFRNDDWYNGFRAYLQSSGNTLSGSSFKQTAISVVLVLVCPAAVALVVVLILKSQMKSVRTGSQARPYVVEESKKLRVREDVFTHTTEVRRKIEQHHNTGSSGGSSSSRGGFSGTSGKF